MNSFLIIRRFQKEDDHRCRQIIRAYVMGSVYQTFFCCIFKEITVQVIVITWAVMFIFLGVPLTFCTFSVPGCIFLMFFCVFTSCFGKAQEIANSSAQFGWIVESYEPFLCSLKKHDIKFDVFEELVPYTQDVVRKLKKNIIGTASVNNHYAMNNAAWICRVAIDPKYPFHIVAKPLIYAVLKNCQHLGYFTAELATFEWQDDERDLYSKLGFSTTQIYHKQIIGSNFQIMKAQMAVDLNIWPYIKEE